MFHVCFLFMILYTVLPKESVNKNIIEPSITEYEQFYLLHGSNLRCPCKKISIPHKQFMQVTVTYHHICNSKFIEPTWINGLFMDSYWFAYKRDDIRVRGAAYFNLLSVLCRFADEYVSNTIDTALQETYHTLQLISEADFDSQTSSMIKKLQVNMMREFQRTFDLYRNVTHSSSFVSSYYLNWYVWLVDASTYKTIPIDAVTTNDGCSCGTQSDCIVQAGIFNGQTGVQLEQIPGLMIGCSVVETLFRSTLACLYSKQCIDMIISYTGSNIHDFGPLNVSSSTQFMIDTKIGDIFNQLFVEEWRLNASYLAFFQECDPMHCSYSQNKQKDSIFLITKLLGLHGGLSISLQFLTPYIVKLYFKMKNYCSNNQVTIIA